MNTSQLVISQQPNLSRWTTPHSLPPFPPTLQSPQTSDDDDLLAAAAEEDDGATSDDSQLSSTTSSADSDGGSCSLSSSDDDDESPPGCQSADQTDSAATAAAGGGGVMRVMEAARELYDGVYEELGATTLTALAAGSAGEQAGEGGEGTVLFVRLPVTNKMVAIKQYLSPTPRSDFEREVSIWSEWAAACPNFVMPLLAAEFVPKCGSSRRGASGVVSYAMPTSGPGVGTLKTELKVFAKGQLVNKGAFSPGQLQYYQQVLAALLLALERRPRPRHRLV